MSELKPTSGRAEPRINPVKDRALALAVEASARRSDWGGDSILRVARMFEKYLTEDGHAA